MYVTGKPKSIRNHPQRDALEYAARETVNTSLIRRAYQLHAASPTGYDPKAFTIGVSRVLKQLRNTSGGDECLLVRVWLSDGSKFRAAWKLSYGPLRLTGDLVRVEWPQNGGRPQKQS